MLICTDSVTKLMLTSSTQILQCAIWLAIRFLVNMAPSLAMQSYECNCAGAADHVIVQHASKASTGPAAMVRPVRPWPYRFLREKNGVAWILT